VLAATRRSLSFDRRLTLAGYRPAALIAAKTVSALAVAVTVGTYTAVIMLAFWQPPWLPAIGLAFILGAATYATLGLLIGVLVPGELEGFFLIIMIALVDTFLQNPVGNPLANKPVLAWFPAYAPTQIAAAGAFNHEILTTMIGWSLAWTGAFAVVGLAILRLRNPRPARHPKHSLLSQDRAPAGLETRT
jgi:ABC-2 type transport system permease protein